MSSEDHVKNIAIVGASGRAGGAMLESLLQCGTFNVTTISRQDSGATFAPEVTVKKGDYASSEFLESALKGQDVLIITLPGNAAPELQTNFIKAAAKVGVPWILPNEYGSDGANKEVTDAVAIIGSKKKYLDQIEELGTSSWIGVVNNPWFDFSLKLGSFGIDIPNRKATIYDDGTNAITTTTLPQVGRAVARLLSLPVHSSSSAAASLSDYKNKYIYINSFYVSQNEMLAAVQRATGTKPEDWTVAHTPVDDFIKEGHERVAKGDFWGMVNILYGSTFKKGLGDKFYGRELANKKLGLEEENMEEVVKRIVKEVEAK